MVQSLCTPLQLLALCLLLLTVPNWVSQSVNGNNNNNLGSTELNITIGN